MKIIIASMAAAGLALSASAAFAQDLGALPPAQSFDAVDTDRNGAVSWAEFSLVFPQMTEEDFRSADLDGDGALSLEEFETVTVSTGSIATQAPALPAGPPKSLTDPSN